MVSRPLVTGSLLGALAGVPLYGAALGASLEVMSLTSLPVGGALSWSATTAAAVAALSAGRGAALELCLLGGLAAGAVHARLEALERDRRAARAPALAAEVIEGRRAMLPSIASSLLIHAAWTAVLCAVSVEAIAAFDLKIWTRATDTLRGAARGAAFFGPWLALSSAAVWCWRRA
jgi:mannose/fructose/N-acetylgalactosamine-specific phosphotransferase system component IIC